MAADEIPNVPSDNPEVIPAQPQKTYDKWFMTNYNLQKNSNNEMNCLVQWIIGRTYVENNVTKIEYGTEAQSFTFLNILSDSFNAANPEMAPLLNDIVTTMDTICKRQGGLNA